MVKGSEEYCPACYGYWSEVQVPATSSGGWNWDRWNSDPPRKPKKKDKKPSRSEKARQRDGGAEGSAVFDLPNFPPPFKSQGQSPFTIPTTYAGANAASSPWQSGDRPQDQPGPSNTELVQAIMKAFPNQSQMPEELREVMGKTNAAVGRQLTSEMHKAAAMMGKARKTIQQVQESQRAHRLKWMQHVAESIDSWKAQLTAFETQQAQYRASIQQAESDIAAARDTIQKLNQEAAGNFHMPKEVDDMLRFGEESSTLDPGDGHLRVKLQAILQSCLEVSGEKIPEKPAEDDLQEKVAQPAPKRHRSTSPDNGNGEKSQPVVAQADAVMQQTPS